MEIVRLPKSTVYDTIARYKSTGSAQPPKRRGHPRKLTPRGQRAIVKIVKKSRDSPLADITDQVNTTVSVTISTRTIRRYMHQLGLRSCLAVKKPLITKVKAKKRLSWASDYRSWGEKWKTVVFSDESKFCLHRSDGRMRIWRLRDEKHHPDCVNPSVKFGGGSVMF